MEGVFKVLSLPAGPSYPWVMGRVFLRMPRCDPGRCDRKSKKKDPKEMKFLPAKSWMLALACCSLAIFTGCLDYTGGGWIPSSANDGSKAHFAFTTHGSGQLEYHDKAAGVSFHATEFNRTGFSSQLTVLTADYTTRGNGPRGTGRVYVELVDGSQFLPEQPDRIAIRVDSGPLTGYLNVQDVVGGNIKFHLDHAQNP